MVASAFIMLLMSVATCSATSAATAAAAGATTAAGAAAGTTAVAGTAAAAVGTAAAGTAVAAAGTAGVAPAVLATTVAAGTVAALPLPNTNMVNGHKVGSVICVGTAVVTAMPTPYPPPTPYPRPPAPVWHPPPMYHPQQSVWQPQQPHWQPQQPSGQWVHPQFGHGPAAPAGGGENETPLKTGFDMHLNLLHPQCEQALVMLGARMSENTCSSGEQEDAGSLFDQTFSPGASVQDFHKLCQDDCVQKVMSAADDVALASHCNLHASQSRFAYIVRNCPRGKWGSSGGVSAGTVILGVAVACLAALIVLILWRYHLKA